MNGKNKQKNTGFNIEKEERGTSPEKLNDCIRIGSTGGILLIAALVIAAVALVVWGFVGSIPVTVTEEVAVVGPENNTNLCLGFVDIELNTGIFPEGTEVNVLMPDGNTVQGKVTTMSNTPMSSEEAKRIYGQETNVNVYLSDWLMENVFGDSSYSYMFFLETEEDISDYWHQVAEAVIITGEIKPISLLTR